MAADDFSPSPDAVAGGRESIPLPPQLAQGLSEDELAELMERATAAVPDAFPRTGPFPLLILGQGLYYESPLTHFSLCEYLAGHGYVVATCPLLGTHGRLVSIDAADLETEVRDLEYVLGRARSLPQVDSDRLGVIGYDLGGMAGLLLAMRNPDVDAFLSTDAGILYGHVSELPNRHPSYDEGRFVIPWMHMTQARFVRDARERDGQSLMDRKTFGDSYLALVESTSHGDFTAYAGFGITRAVPGYWGPRDGDGRPIHEAVQSLCRDFFDACLRDDSKARDRLRQDPSNNWSGVVSELSFKQGEDAPPMKDDVVQMIVTLGSRSARSKIETLRAAYPDSILFDEGRLNWLGYHFLYWWDRRDEAVEVFELIAEIFPGSANAFDSLGEAYAVLGQTERAIASYRRSLALDPNNANAERMLRQLDAETVSPR